MTKSELKETPFLYRQILTIPTDINFGLEIEIENVDHEFVLKQINNQFGSQFQVKKDVSLIKGNNAEIITPVLQNTRKTWEMLKELTELIKTLNPTYDNCSFQINYDASLLPTIEDRVRFIKLFAVYEDIIYRFSKGEDEHYRITLSEYAAPIMPVIKEYKDKLNDEYLVDEFASIKGSGVNFKKRRKDLIEFRTPNGTHNIVLWQNYITTFYYLLKLATNPNVDKKVLDKYIDEFNEKYILELYEKEDMEKALELSNILFTNNLDRTYFLKQYIGFQK